MANQYCFHIIKEFDEIEIDEKQIEELKKFVKNLYATKGKFGDTVPLYTIYSAYDDSICAVLTSSKKDIIKTMEQVNDSLTPSDLEWQEGISLSEPYKFELLQTKWWEREEDDEESSVKWTSFHQIGPYFEDLMEPYKYLGASLILNGKKYKLNEKEEKIAGFYAKRIIQERNPGITIYHIGDDVFDKNFWGDFKEYLSPDNKKVFKTYADFKKIGWEDLTDRIEASKVKLSDMNPLEKERHNIKKEEKKARYSYASIDREPPEKLGNPNVEAQAIFYGRGKHPLRGKIKKQIFPEDVTINIGENDPVPKPPPGHDWKEVVHNHNVVWLAKWKDTVYGKSEKSKTKYIMFASNGIFKGRADAIKYEKSRKLQKYIDIIRKSYMKDAQSSNSTKMQLGTVLYLIDTFGIRVGNEKGEDEAQTVGASTLMVGNVNLDTKDVIWFNFIGKDSVVYDKKFKVPNIIYNNFQKLKKGLNDDDKIFKIKSDDINKYLKTFDKTFSAKVFRTRLASEIMYNALKKVKIPKGSTKPAIKLLFNKANAEVAEVLNHTRTVSKSAQDALAKIEKDIVIETEKLKTEKNQSNIKKIKTKIESLKNSYQTKSDVKAVAITTSLNNYIDPRLVVAWTKKNDVQIKDIYSTLLLKKFNWVIEKINSDWDWGTERLVGNQDLDPYIASASDKPRPRSRTRAQVLKPIQPIASRPAPPLENPKNRRKPPPETPSSSESDSESESEPETETPAIHPPEPESETETPAIHPPEPESEPDSEKPLLPVKHPRVLKKADIPELTEKEPGEVSDYNFLLRICKEPTKYGREISNVNKEVLKWIYPFCKYAIKKGKNLAFNSFIVRYYEKRYLEVQPKAPAPPAKAHAKANAKAKANSKAPAKAPDIPTKYSYLRFMTVDELKRLCADRMIKCTGSKNNILTSILKDYEMNPPVV
jgi:DNA topoisomerase-1